MSNSHQSYNIISLVLIDLSTGEQDVLFQSEEFMGEPIRWDEVNIIEFEKLILDENSQIEGSLIKSFDIDKRTFTYSVTATPNP